MIHPSYVDLMKVVNQDVEAGEEPIISSRYSIVMATAKRARQLVAGDEALIPAKATRKPLSIAVEELNQNEIQILTEEQREQMYAEEEAKRLAEAAAAEEDAEEAETAEASETDAEAGASEEAQTEPTDALPEETDGASGDAEEEADAPEDAEEAAEPLT